MSCRAASGVDHKHEGHIPLSVKRLNDAKIKQKQKEIYDVRITEKIF